MSKLDDETCLGVTNIYGIPNTQIQHAKFAFTSPTIVAIATACVTTRWSPDLNPPVLSAKNLLNWAPVLLIYTTLIPKSFLFFKFPNDVRLPDVTEWAANSSWSFLKQLISLYYTKPVKIKAVFLLGQF